MGRALDLYDPKSIMGDFSDKDKPEDLDIKMSTLLMQFLFPNDKINKMKTRTGANVDVKSMKAGNSKDLTILISGNCFTRICNDQRNYQSLATLLSYCTYLLAYQFSPNNKLVLCQMIKNYCSKNSRLLAAGDGFNDFSMLREADLSVGILSREILQVRNTCDVIVTNFSQIVDLILVHGTWNYKKILKIALLSFYMHFLLLIPKLFYLNENYNGFAFYDGKNLIFTLNVLVLNLFILLMITFDVPVERALITLNLNVFKDNIYDNNKMILLFGIEALKSLIDSSLVYFISKNIAQTSMNIIGENIDIDTFGNQILYGSYALVIFKVLLLNLKYVNHIHIIITFFCLGFLIAITFINNFYQDSVVYGLTQLNILLSNILIICGCSIYEVIARYVLFLLDYDFLSKLTIAFKENMSKLLFVKNYQQLLTNISRETPRTPNKLDKISFAEVLNKIFTLNKQLDPALENMADVSNDEASNLRISKPLLQFFDQKVEMDYTDYCNMKVTVPYITYLFSLALFLAIDIAIKNYEPQKLAKVIYILLGALLLIPKLKENFSKIFPIYFSIILIIELIFIYANKSDNDVKICLQTFILINFPLNYCPKNEIITIIIFLYVIGITPANVMNDYDLNRIYGVEQDDFLYRNLCLIYLRQMSIYGVVILQFISSHYAQLKNRIEFLKYLKSKIELKKDNLIMANLIPEFVRAKMQRGERGAAYGYEEVSIVFCDISNFDSLMAKLSPKDIILFLDEFYSLLDQFCQLHGLQKIETVGKTYMAAGGIKECEIDVDRALLKDHHSIRCFEFAIDILDLVSKMRLNSGDTITVKIGIHKGKVIPAVVGDHKPQFSLIGDTVNTTSRMSSNGEKNCITCSEFAYEEIKTRYKTNFTVVNKQIKGKGLMNLYSYSLQNKNRPTIDKSKVGLTKDKAGNLIAKSSTKNVPVLVKQNTKNSKRKYSVIRSNDISVNESVFSGGLDKKSLIEDSMLIVENSQDLFLKTGDNNQNNIFSDLNRFNNDVNAYNYNNSNSYENKKKLSPTYTMEKKESKFDVIKNNYFSDSYLLLKFKEDVSKNGFRRFENILISKSVKKSIYINTTLSFLLLYSVFIYSHYTKIDEDYLPYLSAKTAIILILILFVFLTDKLVETFPKIKFILLTLTYLALSINNMIYNDRINTFNLINMTVEEIVILTAIESCSILNYLELCINISLHIIIYIVDIITNRENKYIRNYNIFLIVIAIIKIINIITLYYDMTTIFLANQKESKTLVDTEKMLFNLMPLHVVQNMKDDIPVADVLENVTLLFADIVRYTDFGNKHEPVEVVSMLMELFKNFDHATKSCHVYKVHTIGDCYVVMGFNGKVSMNERNYYEEAKNVCKMGEEMITIIRDVRKKVNFELLDMRIGIHTGTVIAGIIGSSVVRYDIFGSDVLIANKMESAGTPGRINISEETKKY
jgi:phospholipid-translocating ATPase